MTYNKVLIDTVFKTMIELGKLAGDAKRELRDNQPQGQARFTPHASPDH